MTQIYFQHPVTTMTQFGLSLAEMDAIVLNDKNQLAQLSGIAMDEFPSLLTIHGNATPGNITD